MKKLTLLFAVLIMAVACGSDDAQPVTATSSIVGKWKLEKIFTENEYENLDDCEKQNILEFLSNGTLKEQDYYTGTGNVCTAQTPSAGTYTLQGTALTFTNTGGTFNETATVAADTLVLIVNQRYNGPDGGAPYTVTYSKVN